MAFTGAWAARSQPQQTVPLTPGIDPQHMDPDPDPNLPAGQRPDWQQAPSATAPDLPLAMLEGLPQVDHVGVGPVDHVDYDDALAGLGFGHGLSELEAIDQSRPAHLDDDGSVAARSYNAAVNRDGTYNAAIVHATPGDGESPQTLAMQQTGVGAPTDQGNSRQSRRVTRWYDGPIDMHWWEVLFRPLRPQFARPVPVHQVVDSSQMAPGTPSIIGYDPSTQDRFVTPMSRRSPGDWQTPFVADGTASTLVAARDQFGLTSWGA